MSDEAEQVEVVNDDAVFLPEGVTIVDDTLPLELQMMSDGRPVLQEMLAKRTETTKTFYNWSTGTRRLISANRPIHYIKDQYWVDITGEIQDATVPYVETPTYFVKLHENKVAVTDRNKTTSIDIPVEGDRSYECNMVAYEEVVFSFEPYSISVVTARKEIVEHFGSYIAHDAEGNMVEDDKAIHIDNETRVRTEKEIVAPVVYQASFNF